MVVRTFDITPGHAGRMGLDIGSSNVREYFPHRVDAIELELDHLCILCAVGPEFWEDRPEIHDLRLSIWLEAKRMGGKLAGTHAPMAMTPTALGAFRLEVMAPTAVVVRDAVMVSDSVVVRDAVNRDPADYALTGTSGSLAAQTSGFRGLTSEIVPEIPTAIAKVMAPVMAFDRRKRSIAHDPERRGVRTARD